MTARKRSIRRPWVGSHAGCVRSANPRAVEGATSAGAGTVRAVRDWLVAADDRTGAFEVAGLLARVVGPVRVTVGEACAGNGVVDLESRALSLAEASVMAAAVEGTPSVWSAHKIDSTLRGNWAGELLARQAVSGRRVVVLPGWPELGRTCVDGIVRVHGESIGRPADHLPGADELSDAAALRNWLSSTRSIAICDLPDDDAMNSLADALCGADVLVAGPGGPLGAAFAARSSAPTAPPLLPSFGDAIAVVCGSANSVSHEQLRRLAIARPDITVISTSSTDGELQADVAKALAERAARRLNDLQPDTLVVIGGDTAAALLGGTPRLVGGLIAPGMPWSRGENDRGPLVVTKAGGFGGPDALVDLLRGETVSVNEVST